MIVRTLLAIQLTATAVSLADDLKPLDAPHSKTARLARMKEIQKAPEKTRSDTAIPLLVKFIDESDQEIRREAVVTLAYVCMTHSSPCPARIAEALFDPDESVQEQALTYVDSFSRYPTEARKFLLRAALEGMASQRSASAGALARLDGLDAEILAVLRKLASDEELQVRQNAHVALWKVSRDVEAVIRHCLSVLDRLRESGAEKLSEQQRKDLILYGTAAYTLLERVTKTAPGEASEVMAQMLSDPSPAIRRGAARSLGVMAHRNVRVKRYVLDLQADAELRKLFEDPETSVRLAAREGVEFLQRPTEGK